MLVFFLILTVVIETLIILRLIIPKIFDKIEERKKEIYDAGYADAEYEYKQLQKQHNENLLRRLREDCKK